MGKLMRIFNYAHYEDFGHDWFIQFFEISQKFCFIDASAQWDDFPVSDFFPLLVFNIGSNSLFGFCFRWKRFELRITFFTFMPRNLMWYKEYLNGTH